MVEPLPISALEIIGFANRLTETMRPAVVAPIFRLRSDRGRIFFPPYVIQEGVVYGALEKTELDLQPLDGAGEVTRFTDSFPALQDHELWLDEAGARRYDPISRAEEELRQIAVCHIAEAVSALQAGRDASAKEHCRIALRADDRFVEPLAINAAIARRQNDQGAERLMAELAGSRITPEGFASLVSGYAGNTRPPVHLTEPARFPAHSISGIAAIRIGQLAEPRR